MTIDDLAEQMEAILGVAIGLLKQKQKIHPFAFFFKGDHPPMIVPMIFGDPGKKMLMIAALREYAEKEKAEAGIFLTDAYVIRREAAIAPQESPTEAPDRKDAIIMQAIIKGDGGRMIIQRYEKSEAGVLLGPKEVLGSEGVIDGIFNRVFDEEMGGQKWPM